MTIESVLEELRAREPIFHRREWGTSEADLLRMTDEGFWEIGASGTPYSRAFVISTLLERYRTTEEGPFECSDFRIRELAADLYLLHYILTDEHRRTWRTTLWRRTPEGWKICFHQGTIIPTGASP